MKFSDIVSSGSFVIASASFIYSWITDRKFKKQRQIQGELDIKEKLNNIEDKNKALLNAKIIKEESFNDLRMKFASFHICIINRGQSTARNIDILSPTLDHPDSKIRIQRESGKIPYPLLNDGDSFNIPILIKEEPINNPVITLVWGDDFSPNRKRDQVLDID